MTTLPLPTSFALTLRGYDRTQVDEHIAALEQDIQLLSIDRDAAVAEAENLARHLADARAENETLQARFDRMCRTPANPEAVGDRVARVLELARAEAAEIVAAARQQANALVREADEAAAVTLTDARERAQHELAQAHCRLEQLERTRRQVSRQLAEIDTLLAHSASLLDEEPAETTPPIRRIAA